MRSIANVILWGSIGFYGMSFIIGDEPGFIYFKSKFFLVIVIIAAILHSISEYKDTK
jgi:hypothetical protein